MKRKLIIVFYVFAHLLVTAVFAEEVYVTKLQWNNEKNALEYMLSGKSLVKIRAGSPDGPVYQTIVNLEERSAGQNKEIWEKRDLENAGIDFTNYAPFHFCVDTKAKIIPDFRLIINTGNTNLPSLDLTKGEPLNITVDIPSSVKQSILSEKTELRIFIDNKLVKQYDPETYPYPVKLNTGDILEGRHLLSINCFQKINGGVCGYNNLFLNIAENKVNPKIEQDGPDAKIAYAVLKDGFWQISLSDSNGLNSKILINTPIDKRHPDWSPDGHRIAYTTNTGELWIIDIGTGEEEKIDLPVNCNNPKWSPCGTKILFTSYTDLYHSNTELWTIDIVTKQLTQITNRPWLQYQSNWSPDGKSIIFVDGPELYGQEIRKLDLQAGDIVQLTEDGPYNFSLFPVFHSSGEMIFYCSNKSGDNEIWSIDKYGQNPVNLTNCPSNDIMPIAVSDKIYFLSDRSGYSNIWQMDVNGSNLKQITNYDYDVGDITVIQ